MLYSYIANSEMSNMRILRSITGVIVLSVVCVTKQSLISVEEIEQNAPNRTQLQQEISGFLSQVETAELKYSDFAKYQKQSTGTYNDIKELITNKEKYFDGFKHVLCQDLEAYFEGNGTELNKILDDCNVKFEGNQQKIENYRNILNNISNNLNECNETAVNECLNENKINPSGLDDFLKHLEWFVNDTNEDFNNCKADVDDLLSKITSLGYNTRSCLSKLYDAKDRIILNNSSISDVIDRVYSQFAKGVSDSQVVAKTSVRDLDEQISAFKNEYEEYQKKADEKHSNTSKCIYNENEFEKRKQMIIKLFSETADEYVSRIDNEMSTALKKMRKLTPNFYQEFDQLSKCSDEACLNEVTDSAQAETNFVIANITQASKAYKDMVSELTSAFKRSANDSIGSFTSSINQEDLCSESRIRISDYGLAYENNSPVYLYNIKHSINSFNASYYRNISMMIKDIQKRERNAVENNIEISRCVIKSNTEISNNMRKFNHEITHLESQAIKHFNESREKLNSCLDESCMNDILASYEAQSQHNLAIIEDKKNPTLDYIEKIKTDLSELLIDSLKRSAEDFNKLSTCLSTAEEIHKQGSSVNSSVDVILNRFDKYLGSITPFIKTTKDTVNENVKSKLKSAVEEIKAKEHVANNEKLDLKSCMKNDNLQKLVSTAMAIFNSEIDKEQEDVDETINRSVSYVQNAKSFTRNHLDHLDVCSTKQCMEDLARNLEKYKSGTLNAIRSVDDSVNQHISRIKDSVIKLGENYLNNITIDLDISKKKVFDCLMAKINSSSAFKSTFVIILLLLLLIYKLLP